MSSPALFFRARLDRMGVMLSALCMVHCLGGLLLVMVLGVGGGFLLDPRIHEYGLALAVTVGALGLGLGALHHRRMGVLALGLMGLTLMSCGLMVSHGPREALVTVAGVSLVALAHIRNLRHGH